MKINPDQPVEMTLCMGSSCYARGNGSNLAVLEEYIETHRLDAQVILSGSRCEGSCSEGPNLTVNGKRYAHVDRETLLQILKDITPEQGAPHE